MGVPQLDRLADYRPSLAIVAEGLPEADVPFDLPEGMGAEVIHTDDVVDPLPFNEPFTQTDSWILFRDWYDIPEGTDVYLVAYNPAEYTGKLLVAVGLVEDFSDVDMSEFGEWLDKTQAFHEIGDTEDHVEPDCSQVYDGEDDGAYVTPDAEPSKSGCTVTSPRAVRSAWRARSRSSSDSPVDVDDPHRAGLGDDKRTDSHRRHAVYRAERFVRRHPRTQGQGQRFVHLWLFRHRDPSHRHRDASQRMDTMAPRRRLLILLKKRGEEGESTPLHCTPASA